MIDLKIFFKNIFTLSKVKIKIEVKKTWLGKVKKSYIKISGKNELYFGKNAEIKEANIAIKGNNNKIIFEDDCKLRGLIIKFNANNSILKIGKRTTTENVKIVMGDGKIIIGENCMFSKEIEIRNLDSHTIVFQDGKINKNKDIIIGNHVWVGLRSLILKGSKIEENSIIGAGSVVAGKFEKNSIIVGNPAKKVKEILKWER